MFLITGNFALSNQMNDNEINNKQQEANRAYKNIVRSIVALEAAGCRHLWMHSSGKVVTVNGDR